MSASKGQAAALGWLLLIGALPLARLLAELFRGAGLPDDPAIWRAAGRSLALAAGTTAVALALGVTLAAVLLLRRIPGRRVLLFGAILPLLVPPQVMALAVSQAAGPASPLLLALGLAPPLGAANLAYTPAAMMLVLGVQSAPLVLLAIAALCRRLPDEAMMAARSLGCTPGAALRRVAWPLLLPGVLAGAGLAWIAALGNFGVAASLGIPARWPVLTVLLWQRLGTGGPQALSQAASLAVVLAGLALPGLAAQVFAARRRPLPEGRPFAPLPLRGGGGVALVVAAYLLLVLGLPLLALAATALVPALGMALGLETLTARHFAAALAPGAQTARAVAVSLGLSAGAACVLALAALPVALALRARPVRIAAAIADLPQALPGAVTAVAAILVVLPWGGALYGSTWLIGLAYLTRFQALALRPVAAAAARLDPRLDFAARGMAAGLYWRARAVWLPPLAPALAAGGLVVTLLAVNEVTVSALLVGPGAVTLGTLVFNLQDAGQAPLAAATSLLALGLVAALMAAATLAGRGLPAGTLPWRP
ncbi:iron(III) transport system permease protein [Humitalea rosea]|uniref:Iron(III) transport system permease protein n=1 Tax=Humitalea rosea TaxID=990373 RepID=A0A2W7JF68_9PROT|nr:ABC transporter permease subunit [Humitalea rosea]PZW51137.1 iron(III) transport system permease protein [Humitalea rosea]